MRKTPDTYHCDECGEPVSQANRCPDHPDARLIRDARRGMPPKCVACGGYLLPCTATATGIHPSYAPVTQ